MYFICLYNVVLKNSFIVWRKTGTERENLSNAFSNDILDRQEINHIDEKQYSI